LGIQPSLWAILRNNWRPAARREPVRVYFAPPLSLDDLYAEGDRPASQKQIADRMRASILALAERDRTARGGAAAQGER
jgi:hypothetical protein